MNRRRISSSAEARVIALLDEARCLELDIDVTRSVMASVRERSPGRLAGPAAGPVGLGVAAGALGGLASATALVLALTAVRVPSGPETLGAGRSLGTAALALFRALGSLLEALGRAAVDLAEIAARTGGNGDPLFYLTSAAGLASVLALLTTATFALWRDLRPATHGLTRMNRRIS